MEGLDFVGVAVDDLDRAMGELVVGDIKGLEGVAHVLEHEFKPVIGDLVVHDIEMLNFREVVPQFSYLFVVDAGAVQLQCVQVLEFLQHRLQEMHIALGEAHFEDLDAGEAHEAVELGGSQLVAVEDELDWVGHDVVDQHKELLLDLLLLHRNGAALVDHDVVGDQVLLLLLLFPLDGLQFVILLALQFLLPLQQFLLQAFDLGVELLDFGHFLLDLVLGSLDVVVFTLHFLVGVYQHQFQVVFVAAFGHLVRVHVSLHERLLVVVLAICLEVLVEVVLLDVVVIVDEGDAHFAH